MPELISNPAPIQPISDPRLKSHQISLYLKREDLIHPRVSGNKWRKLKYNLNRAAQSGTNQLVTIGGAFSNHIYATAAAGKEAGFKTVGLIRGDKLSSSNPTLKFCQDQGMELRFLDRSQYREINAQFLDQLRAEIGEFYFIPEGGSNSLGVAGCSEIIEELHLDYDFLCSPVGTGGTLAGLVAGLKGKGRVLGFPALKGAAFLAGRIRELTNEFNRSDWSNFELIFEYHFGGYAKYEPGLITFINEFKRDHKIQLDPVYTGKMMFGIFDLIQKGYFPAKSVIVALHTGGIQGIAGFNLRFGNLIESSE